MAHKLFRLTEFAVISNVHITIEIKFVTVQGQLSMTFALCLPSAYRFIGDWTIAWRTAVGGKASNEGRVNSCLVALIATESVSIALSWLLLPPEVGVNRHGHSITMY